ncbi:MAG: hypothetical protein K1X88_06280 [Nannocystaceae bacterium]|nr:hypothetical protein [Nannocystaceae bacterium]
MSSDDDDTGEAAVLARRHHRVGWSMVLVFACAGLLLESLAGFRVAWFSDADMETRRTMWRLAHAHGALLGLLNAVLANTLRSGGAPRWSRRSAMAVMVGSVAVPSGFALGGIWFVDGDPSPAIILVPAGALALIAGLFDALRR